MSSWRVKDKKTGSFVSKDLKFHTNAAELCRKLNATAAGRYECVHIAPEKELPDVSRDMNEWEIFGIKSMRDVTFASGTNHKSFVNSLLFQVDNDKQITEKQSAYLWHLVYRYRRQVQDIRLIQFAQKNKVY